MTDKRSHIQDHENPSGSPKGSRGTSRTRRVLLVRILAGVLVLLAVVGVPGYIATRPGFFGRFPGLSEKYEPWSKSTHVAAACQECHVGPGPLRQSGYAARMVGEFYVSLFSRSRVPSVFGKPGNEACLSCHDDLRSVSPKGDLRIPHRAHVTVLDMDCVQCHNYLVHEKSPEGKYVPPMGGCLTCHDGDRAKDACTACHTEKAAPEGHRAANWGIVHAEKSDDPECESCHKWKDDWCVDCHSRRPKSHGNDWRKAHRDSVEKHRGCEACHEGSFCVECHGEVPSLNVDPTLKLVE